MNAITRYRGPLLQSHGDQDQTVPFAMGERLFLAADGRKRMITIAKAGHNDWLTEEYLQVLDDFINEVAPEEK